MNAFIEDILTRIQDLLELAPPVSIMIINSSLREDRIHITV